MFLAGGFPSNAAGFPDGSLETTGALDHPLTGFGLHALRPLSRQYRDEKPLNEAHGGLLAAGQAESAARRAFSGLKAMGSAPNQTLDITPPPPR